MSVHNHTLIPSLDGIRAISISIVFFAHAGVVSFLPGGFGVTIFFFLSGFLITTLFYREVERTGGINLPAFYTRRLLRLSPPLFITLFLVYFLVSIGFLEGVVQPEAVLSQVFYYYNYYAILSTDATEGALGLNVLWSLAVEEHFYLIFPFLFTLILRNQIRSTHLFAVLFVILIWRVVKLSLLGAGSDSIYMATDTRFDSILVGAFLAVLIAEGKAAAIFPQKPFMVGGLIVFAILVLLFTFLYRDPFFRSTLRYSLQGMALIPLFYYSVNLPNVWIFRLLNWRPIRVIGVYSYTIYLVHTVVLGNLEGSALEFQNRALFGASAFLICLVYAAVIFRFVELPIKAIRGRLVSKRLSRTY